MIHSTTIAVIWRGRWGGGGGGGGDNAEIFFSTGFYEPRLLGFFPQSFAASAQTRSGIDRRTVTGNSYWRNTWSDRVEWYPLNVHPKVPTANYSDGEDAVLGGDQLVKNGH